jgi:alginate O-acetyltransferase complex protein AlgI
VPRLWIKSTLAPLGWSRFLRDFIYIPLGGSRGGGWFVTRNLLITMLLGGLWHGAAWTFVLWGGFHGTGTATEWVLRGRVHAPRWLRWLVVFHLVIGAWVLFRASDLAAAGQFLGRLVASGPATLWTVPVAVLAFAVIVVQVLPERPLNAIRVRFEELNAPALATTALVAILCVAATVPSQGVPPFIYFRRPRRREPPPPARSPWSPRTRSIRRSSASSVAAARWSGCS